MPAKLHDWWERFERRLSEIAHYKVLSWVGLGALVLLELLRGTFVLGVRTRRVDDLQILLADSLYSSFGVAPMTLGFAQIPLQARQR